LTCKKTRPERQAQERAPKESSAGNGLCGRIRSLLGLFFRFRNRIFVLLLILKNLRLGLIGGKCPAPSPKLKILIVAVRYK
jgi:hypothetical protein